MIIECKKVTGGHWIFLVSDDEKKNVTQARLLWTHREPNKPNISDWDEFQLLPDSPESAFCVVRGQGDKGTPMLERLASILLRSTESIANEELSLGTRWAEGEPCIYFPVIITNATLQVCHFDPQQIDLSTGQLPDGKFEPVPFVRFRKNLSTVGLPQKSQTNLEAVNMENERTIFIINSAELSTVLKEWNIHLKVYYHSPNHPWPWYTARLSEARR